MPKPFKIIYKPLNFFSLFPKKNLNPLFFSISPLYFFNSILFFFKYIFCFLIISENLYEIWKPINSISFIG